MWSPANSLGELPESEMERIELFDTVPDVYTYDVEDERRQIAAVDRILKAYTE